MMKSPVLIERRPHLEDHSRADHLASHMWRNLEGVVVRAGCSPTF